jgi:hypothetical protein
MNELCHINIERGRLSDEIELDPLPRNFLYKILDKYGDLNAMQLEEAVYNTKPLKIYQGLVKDGIKNKTGEEILDSNLKIKDFKNDKKVMGRLGAFNHINKYPDINIEQLKRFGKEFEFLESLRPEW